MRVVLSHTTHPGNIGACARAMKTMGLERLYLVNPKFFPDPQAVAMASGAADLLERARVCASLEEALAGTTYVLGSSARRRDLAPVWLSPRQAGERLVGQAQRGEVALLMGTERMGLSTEEALQCHALATIPANPEYPSLNLASALQILAYEIRLASLDGWAVPVPPDPPATREDMDMLYQRLEQTLVIIGFLDPTKPRRLMDRLRRLFGRAGLEQNEVNILQGILAHAQNGPWQPPDQ